MDSTMLLSNPEESINFEGRDWSILREWLRYEIDSATYMLCGNITHDESNKLRGKILFAKTILDLEAAQIARRTTLAPGPHSGY